MCVSNDSGVSISKDVMAAQALTEVAMRQCETLATDLEMHVC